MKLTNELIGKEVIRNATFIYPTGVQDRSYMRESMKLVGIEEDGTLVFIQYNPMLYMGAKILEEDTPKEGYVYSTLNASWNDGKWRVASEDDTLNGMDSHDNISCLALSMTREQLKDVEELSSVEALQLRQKALGGMARIERILNK